MADQSKSIAVTGKGYVDGVHDNEQLRQSILPAASATGLFISRILQMSPPEGEQHARRKILERR